MSDKGCCFCLPSWVATIPGWLIAIAALTLTIFGSSTASHVAICVVNIIPYILSVALKGQVWPRVILMIFYMAASVFIAVMSYVIAMVSGGDMCRDRPETCAPTERRAIFICASWSILQIFIWIGLGYFIKSAHDSRSAETHPYQRN